MREFIINCISWLSAITPGILFTGVCEAVAVTAIARLLGVPLGGLIARLPRAASITVRVILFLLVLPAPTLTGILLRRIYESDLAVMAWCRALVPWLNPITLASALSALIVSLPIAVLFAAAAFRHVDPETVLAARTLGMRNAVIRRKVILPQARSGIVTGVTLCAARAMGESIAAAVTLADAASARGDLLTVFAVSMESGAYLMTCLWIAGWLLAACILLLLYHLLTRRHTTRRHTR